MMKILRWESVHHDPCNSNSVHWTILPQNSAYIALPSYQQRGGGGGQDRDIQHDHDTYIQSWLSFCSQPNLHSAEQDLQNLHEFFTITLWLGKTYKALFFILGNTRTSHPPTWQNNLSVQPGIPVHPLLLVYFFHFLIPDVPLHPLLPVISLHPLLHDKVLHQLLLTYLFILFYWTALVVLFHLAEVFILFRLAYLFILFYWHTPFISSSSSSWQCFWPYIPLHPLLPHILNYLFLQDRARYLVLTCLFILLYLTEIFILFHLANLFFLLAFLLADNPLYPLPLTWHISSSYSSWYVTDITPHPLPRGIHLHPCLPGTPIQKQNQYMSFLCSAKGRLIYQCCNPLANVLKGPSHQIRSAWKWYGWIGLGRDIRRWTF